MNLFDYHEPHEITTTRKEGWWTNFSESVRPAFTELLATYQGPGKLVIRPPVGRASDGGSLWVEPPPADWQAFNEAVGKTNFNNHLRRLMEF